MIEGKRDADENGGCGPTGRSYRRDNTPLSTTLVVRSRYAHDTRLGCLHHRSCTTKPMPIRHPAREASAPIRRSGVSYRNVILWVPAGTTTARTNVSARRIGSSAPV